jgi:hypothetical protein
MPRYKLGTVTALDRFEMKVEKIPFDTCWWWTACKNADGYGTFWYDGKVRGAHIAAYLLFRGTISIGQRVLHKCDNPSCVNPRHLWLGTQQENIRDCVSKNRQAKGFRKANCKLTPESVLCIRKDRKLGMRYKDLANKYGVTVGAIQQVIIGRNWKYVSNEEQM